MQNGLVSGLNRTKRCQVNMIPGYVGMMKGITVGGGNFWRERIPTYVMYYGTLIVGGQKLSHIL